MVSDQGLYWIAVGVLTFGISNSYITRHDDWVRSVSGQVIALADHAADRMAMAEMLLGRGHADLGRTQMTAVRVQTKLACVQTRLAGPKAQLTRFQVERATLIANQQMKRVVILCPRQELGMDMPKPLVDPDEEMTASVEP